MSRKSKRRPVVLYQPRDEGGWMPLGLLALGSHLSGEHVVIVDGRFDLAPEARVAELAPDAICLGVTVRTGPPLRDALRVSAAARAVNPRLTIVWGGPHATYAPRSCLATGVVDACARGAGEEVLAAAVLAGRDGGSLAEVRGLLVKGSGDAASGAASGGRVDRACALLSARRRAALRGERKAPSGLLLEPWRPRRRVSRAGRRPRARRSSASWPSDTGSPRSHSVTRISSLTAAAPTRSPRRSSRHRSVSAGGSRCGRTTCWTEGRHGWSCCAEAAAGSCASASLPTCPQAGRCETGSSRRRRGCTKPASLRGSSWR